MLIANTGPRKSTASTNCDIPAAVSTINTGPGPNGQKGSVNMCKFGYTCLLVSTIAVIAPVRAQSTTAFDGKYVGVSVVLSIDTSSRHNCTQDFKLPWLTISNGVASGKWGDGTIEGLVTPQGVLTMRATNTNHVDGQIDTQGRINAGMDNFFQGGEMGHFGVLYGCRHELVWQKETIPGTVAEFLKRKVVARDTDTLVAWWGVWQHSPDSDCVSARIAQIDITSPPNHGEVRLQVSDVNTPDTPITAAKCRNPFQGIHIYYKPTEGFLGYDQFTFIKRGGISRDASQLVNLMVQ